ncbi:ACT domain-containing protein [Pyrobaculum aerophilum]|uniref:Acetolactate synthase n=1 Tax=Pyrobaculum aerophilum TaxID=13773 RepID=A0A371R5G3_9CREN|nr:ACT domain-containing protein [Pyrobaculum aerophilum]RFA99241.1 acetolactate synthase [Pyrobaculum aerophilum]
MRISITIPKSLDPLGRVIAITRRAKVNVTSMHVVADTHVYKIDMEVVGPSDEVNWLVAKLDKLPEVLHIEMILNH